MAEVLTKNIYGGLGLVLMLVVILVVSGMDAASLIKDDIVAAVTMCASLIGIALFIGILKNI